MRDSKYNIRTGDLVREWKLRYAPPDDPRKSDVYLVLGISGYLVAQLVNNRTLAMIYVPIHELERVG
jgi:hypothetical protein